MILAAIYISKNVLPHIFGPKHDGLTINLGGKYIYELEELREHVRIKERKINSKFIDKFWLNRIELISAIVGENGTGKTSLLNLFRKPDSFCTYVYESKENDEPILSDNANYFEVIYYSAFFSIKHVDSENDNFRDLSKYPLMIDDVDNKNSDMSSLLELHNSENLKRWIKFIELKNVNTLLKEISLPSFEKVHIKMNSFQIQEHDTSYSFRPFFEDLKARILKERRTREQMELEGLNLRNVEDIRRSKAGQKTRLELTILEDVIKKIQNILENSGNKYLQEGVIANDYTIKSDEYLNQPSSKDAFYWFLGNSFIQISKDSKIYLPVREIKNLIEIILSYLPDNEEIEDWTEFSVNLPGALDILSAYEEFILAFKDHFTFDKGVLMTFKPDINLSSGEKGLYDLFSVLNNLNFRFEKKIHTDYHIFYKREEVSDSFLILLDEADLGFHPEWKKKYVNVIQQIIPFIFKEKNIQIILTTHDPLTLSDIPNINITYLQKDGSNTKVLNIDDPQRPVKTFGANITDLLADSFFVKEGLIGDFAKGKIQETIDWINNCKERRLSNQDRFQHELIYYKKIISLIDEHITKIKLSEMLSELEPTNDFQKSIIDEEIKYLQQRRKNLE